MLQEEPDFDYTAVYEDGDGVRLIACCTNQFEGACSKMMLSQVSTQPGKRIAQNLSGRRTGSGARLGDPYAEMRRKAGRFSVRSRFRQYEINI